MTFDPAAPVTISEADLATPWQRLGAALLDGLVIGVPFMVLTVVLFYLGADEAESARVPFWFTAALTVVFGGYEVVGVALWGQTVGKHLAGVRVCSGRDLGRPGWARGVKRWILYPLVSWIPLLGGVLGILIPLPLLWTPTRQGLHDKLADTLVLRNESVPWA